MGLTWLITAIILLLLVGWAFLRFAPTFGGKPDAETLRRIHASPNFNGRTFVNLTPTHASTIGSLDGYADTGLVRRVEQTAPPQVEKVGDTCETTPTANTDNLLWQFIFPPKGKNPSQPIITEPLTVKDKPLQDGEFVWLGHSTVLFATAGKTFITDPVFHRASPVPLVGKPFAMTHSPTAADLPYIDVVLISHDHYDHLDHRAIKEMRGQVGHFYVPLGVKAHLVRWGVEVERISEYDWYESVATGDVTLTFTPTRHFSGRRLTGHRTTLWGSWVVESPTLRAYFSGDGGYSEEFAKIGARFGGFDIAFIEDGAYNERWQDVHMMPEQSAQAGFDLQARIVLPIHWGKFDLSTHHWREPVRRIRQAIHQGNERLPAERQITLATPRIGQVFSIDAIDRVADMPWWE